MADIARQYPVAATPDAPLLVAELPAEPGQETRALEFLRQGQTNALRVWLLETAGSAQPLTPLAEPMATWVETEFTSEFADYVRTAHQASDGDPTSSGADLSSLGPAMLLRTHTAESKTYTEVLVCAQVRTIGTLFVRVAQFDHVAHAGIADLVANALSRSTALQDNIRIENRAYITYEKGIEIEQKVTLLDEASIWSLTKSMWTAVENGEFSGFITDPGYELTRWHFVQHNFEVLAPAEEIGHFAFIDVPDGSYVLKMKKFPEDALRREEIFRKNVELPRANFEEYLTAEYPSLHFRRLPGFRRTRFDVNVQSLATGHCFGIETDEVTIADATDRKLRQVEMEYLGTRRHAGMDASTIDSELNRLTGLVEEHLSKLGIAAERSLYSKLSFLRDHSADAFVDSTRSSRPPTPTHRSPTQS
jgi:hypothetical protein